MMSVAVFCITEGNECVKSDHWHRNVSLMHGLPHIQTYRTNENSAGGRGQASIADNLQQS
jgi:hypothetical protein